MSIELRNENVQKIKNKIYDEIQDENILFVGYIDKAFTPQIITKHIEPNIIIRLQMALEAYLNNHPEELFPKNFTS